MKMSCTTKYGNFVKPQSGSHRINDCIPGTQNGDVVKEMYIKEVLHVKDPLPATWNDEYDPEAQRKVTNNNGSRQLKPINEVNNKKLFTIVQNNDVDQLVQILNSYPAKLHAIDEFGWSLLMIACQASSIETVKELLDRGADTTVRDKAGNSAHSLVIKNKNVALANLLLCDKNVSQKKEQKRKHKKKTEEFVCDICNCTYSDKKKHASSTIHNISASKGKKIPSNFKIPESNRGFQMMLKGGWDKESGLGRDGSGKKYPIKTSQKKDRKGLGLIEKKQEVKNTDTYSTLVAKSYQDHRKMEISFRREFY